MQEHDAEEKEAHHHGEGAGVIWVCGRNKALILRVLERAHRHLCREDKCNRAVRVQGRPEAATATLPAPMPASLPPRETISLARPSAEDSPLTSVPVSCTLHSSARQMFRGDTLLLSIWDSVAILHTKKGKAVPRRRPRRGGTSNVKLLRVTSRHYLGSPSIITSR